MYRNIALITVLSLALSSLSASGPLISQSGMVTILPEDCRLLAGEELLLELSGSLPSEAVVKWSVNYGEVVYLLPGSNAILIAPTTPSVITIYATITGTKPGRWVYVNRQCIVSEQDILDG
jgi:hypothetical protein